MPSRTPVPSSAAHWSKDFVEHLRTVHFTLIAVAIGLILIVVSAKPYNAAVALREIHQIIELKKMWSVKWIMGRGIKKQIPESGTSFGIEGLPVRSLAAIGETDDSEPVSTLFTEPTVLRSLSDLSSMDNFPIVQERGFIGKVRDARIPFSIQQYWLQEPPDPDWSPETFPVTLADFGQWWNRLGQSGFRVVFPRSLFELRGYCLTASGRADVGSLEASGPPRLSDVSLDLSIQYDTLTYSGVGEIGICSFPVRRFVYAEVSQRMVAHQFKNWRVGPFDSSFPDLAQATHDLETLELDDIEKFVSTEAAKGSEVFEAFGMKFPAGQITFWGIIVLLGVQLYFFVYLKQLVGKLSLADPGWDVPWIGMDTSVLAQLIFFLTVFLLPLLAMVMLGKQAISALERPIEWRSWTTAGAVGICAALIPVTILAVLSWTCRPKVQEGGDLPDRKAPSGATSPSTISPEQTGKAPDSDREDAFGE